jgi:ClpP class serine protease
MALGGNEIIMGRYGCLGPIDPQTKVKRKDGTDAFVSYRDFVSYLDFYKNEAGLTEQAYTENAFKSLIEHVEPWMLGMGRRASSLSVTIAEKLLQIHMTEAEEKIKAT